MPDAGTIRATHPNLREAEERLKAKGYPSVEEALRCVKLDRMTYRRSLVHGLAENPRSKTIEKLEALGVLDIAKRAQKSG